MSLMQSHSKSASLIESLTRPAGANALLARLVQVHALWRQRQHLATLDDAALSDIGLSREDALREAGKPVWDVPQSWRR